MDKQDDGANNVKEDAHCDIANNVEEYAQCDGGVNIEDGHDDKSGDSDYETSGIKFDDGE